MDQKKKVCAVVPAYNEEISIENVIRTLLKFRLIDEIIIVDDGSDDRTKDIAKKYNRNVKLIINEKNYGKGQSMERGVMNCDSDYILFCDSDLINIKPEYFDDIIRIILKNDCDMVIACRNKFNSRLTLLSGQRVIKRELWERIPRFYKKGFRIELGMNFFSENHDNKIFEYSQTIKEVKRGLLWGLYRRFFMIYHLFSAILRFFLYDNIRRRFNNN